MLNPGNLKANTMISQSFIASEFQGYTDNGPTSSLNQFVKSKPMHDSGIVNEGEKQTFGFDNLNKPANRQPTRLQSFSRQQVQQPKYTMTKPQGQQNVNAHYQSSNQTNNNQQQVINQRFSQGENQGYSNQNYTQVQTNSPVKMQKQRYVSPNIVKMQTPNIGDSKFQVNKSMNYNEVNYRSSNDYSQQNQSQSQQSQRLGSSYQQQSLAKSTSTEGRKFKMNVSQQFSNSFTLKNVNQPQRSNIIAMKNRARQYRKSIQNFII